MIISVCFTKQAKEKKKGYKIQYYLSPTKEIEFSNVPDRNKCNSKWVF